MMNSLLDKDNNMNISVLILTLNEEMNLPKCLDSVRWCDDIVILDSYSEDKTKGIAEGAGVRIVERKFDNYANQRNYGINQIKYKYKWLLMLDADEVVSDSLYEEMHKGISNVDDTVCIFRMRRKDYLFGKWIKYSSKYPIWFGRLIRIGYVHVEREINEEYHTKGNVDSLKSHLIHYPFNKGFHAWFEKHNRYSSMEAELKQRKGVYRCHFYDFMSKDPVLRRKALKAIFHRLPARSLLIFFLLFIVRGGIFEGRAGLTYCILTSFYEYMIDCKVKELDIRKQGKQL